MENDWQPAPLTEEIRPEGGWNDPILSISQDQRGRLLIGGDGALWVFDGRDWQSTTLDLPGAPTLAALDSHTGKVWFISYREFGYFPSIAHLEADQFVSYAEALEAFTGGRAWSAFRLVALNDRVMISMDQGLTLLDNGVFLRAHHQSSGWTNLDPAGDAAHWYAGEDNFGTLTFQGIHNRPVERVSRDQIVAALGDAQADLLINAAGVWSVPDSPRAAVMHAYPDELREIIRRAYHVDSLPLAGDVYACATFEEGLKILSLRDGVLWERSEGEAGGERRSIDVQRIYRLAQTREADLFVAGPGHAVRWQKPGLIWDWSMPGASMGTARASDGSTTFVFPEGALRWTQEKGVVEPVSLLDGRYFVDTVATEGGDWFTFRDWVAWRDRETGEVFQKDRLEDEIARFVPWGDSGDRGVAVGHAAYHLVQREPDGLRSTPIGASTGTPLSAAVEGNAVWTLFADGSVERIRLEETPAVIGERTAWNLGTGVLSGGEIGFWREIPFVTSAAGFFLHDPLLNDWKRVDTLDSLEITAHTFGPDGDLIMAAVTRRTERALEQPFILNLGRRPSAMVTPEARWIGADLPLKRATLLHFDAERKIWWLGGSGKVFSIADAVLRPLDAVPAIEVIATLPGAVERGGIPRLAFDSASLQFGWFFRNWAEAPPFTPQIRLAGRQTEWTALNEPRVQYAGLREGTYTFETRLIDPLGRVHAGPSQRFRIMPPWFRSPVAYAGYLVLLGLAIVASFRVYSFRDRVRREHLEIIVRQRTAELEAANAAKSRFVANMSHELRNPMNGVIGLSELLSRSSLGREQRTLVKTIRACAEQLGQMIGDVLDFSEIEAGRMRFEKQPFGLRAMAERVIDVASWEASQTTHQVRLELEGNVPQLVLSDERKITQILVNFISNACKYARSELVVLRLRTEALMRNRVRVRFEVEDGGPGLTEEERARVFDRFYRSPRATNSPVRGSGLGLAVCAEIAELLGAEIGVLRNERGGSTFFLEVGLALPEGADSRQPIPDYDRDYVGSVLVADDMDYNRLVAAGLLESLGFSVTSVASGKEAIACLLTAEYDFAFLDFDLSDITGPEVVREFRHERPHARTRFFAITAYVSESKRRACEEAGMEDFVAKPVSRTKLREALLATGIDENSLTRGLPRASSGNEVYDLEPLIMLARGDHDRLLAKAEDYLRSLDEEVVALRKLVDRPETDAAMMRKRIHRLLSHGGILKADSLLSAIEYVGVAVAGEPREAWSDAVEGLEEATRELGVNLRRIVESYRLHG